MRLPYTPLTFACNKSLVKWRIDGIFQPTIWNLI
ncbi:hypothetical protein HDE79_003826 [Rhodanobacter sp. MP1X3]|nr:hypothetical protein [Rhodanobacter sp. MP1X3]